MEISIYINFRFRFSFADLSHGGYQDLDDIENPSENIIPTEDPFKLLTNPKRLEPYFDPNVNQNVTALVGKSAYLNCIAKNLGNKTVEFESFQSILPLVSLPFSPFV
jgi:hypothetical protein